MPKKPNPTQSEKFKAAARELGASESEANFNKKLKKIAKAKLSERPKRKAPKA